jgi:hypothetical protein
MSDLWHWLKHEFHEVLPPAIFFFISFHIVAIDRRLMLRQYGLPLSSIASATLAALLIRLLATDGTLLAEVVSPLEAADFARYGGGRRLMQRKRPKRPR